MRPPLCQPLHSLGRHHCEPFCTRLGEKNVTAFRHVFRGRNTRHSLKTKVAPFQKAATFFFSNLLQPLLPFQKSLDLPLPLPCIHIRTLCQEYTAQHMFSVCGQNTSPGGRQEQDLLWVLKKKNIQIFGTTKASFINFFYFLIEHMVH